MPAMLPGLAIVVPQITARDDRGAGCAEFEWLPGEFQSYETPLQSANRVEERSWWCLAREFHHRRACPPLQALGIFEGNRRQTPAAPVQTSIFRRLALDRLLLRAAPAQERI